MVRISAKAEYACVAMVDLAAQFQTGQPVQVKTIAESHGISPRFLVQILIQLKGAGLVASSRGVSGGYQLSRSPDAIHLAEIIYTIDRSPQPPSALNSLTSSVAESLRQVWKEVDKAEQQLLQKTTLADLTRRIQEKDVTSYQI
ncbi:MAG TPA: Rrf2 family transcriptional regulator [Gemmataceae bacterium]|nr:Rrf2 family transcriptional regulator [Gemmataceae bacterium]